MRRKLPPLTSLRAFDAAARTLSFRKAAQELHVTPTAVSHQIRALEEWLGVRLFERTTRSVRLTDAGALYLPAVHTAFDGLELATERIARGPTDNTLTISTTTSFITKWLIPRLGSFQAAYPDIDVRITTSAELVDFRTSDIDMGVRFGRGKWPDVVSHRLRAEHLFPVCSPKLLRGAHPLRSPEDLQKHTFLHVSPQHEEWQMWLTAAGHPELKPAREVTFDEFVTALQAAIDGLGVTIGYTNLASGDLEAGRLVAPFDISVPGDFAYYIVYAESASPKSGPRATVVAFRDWLLSCAADVTADSAPERSSGNAT